MVNQHFNKISGKLAVRSTSVQTLQKVPVKLSTGVLEPKWVVGTVLCNLYSRQMQGIAVQA